MFLLSFVHQTTFSFAWHNKLSVDPTTTNTSLGSRNQENDINKNILRQKKRRKQFQQNIRRNDYF